MVIIKILICLAINANSMPHNLTTLTALMCVFSMPFFNIYCLVGSSLNKNQYSDA